MNEEIKKFHHAIESFFYLLTQIALQILAVILGIASWAYPVFNIWTDLIDGEFNLLKSFGYIILGVSLFYTSLALHKVNDKLNTKE